jgi:hypothetical protein
MIEEVTLREIEAILAVTDRMGVHREDVVIPLMPRRPGRVRRMPNGKVEIVVDADADLQEFLDGLEARIREALGQEGRGEAGG